jgi:hypothetical protein
VSTLLNYKNVSISYARFLPSGTYKPLTVNVTIPTGVTAPSSTDAYVDGYVDQYGSTTGGGSGTYTSIFGGTY